MVFISGLHVKLAWLSAYVREEFGKVETLTCRAYGGWPPVGLAATDIPFCDGLSRETARFGPNPGREPFGAKFWQFGGFRAAIKTAFWDYWETARFGSNPGREPIGAKFWQFGGFRAAIKTAFWNYWETARFRPNPGREPFGAGFWQFAGF